MDNQETTPSQSSLGDHIINVFSAPGEAFSEVGTSPKKGRFWVPTYFVTILFAIAFTFVMFSNETLKEQVMEAQEKAIQERVEGGSVTQEQADRQIEGMRGMGGLFIVFGSIGAVIMVSLYFFGAALVLFLIGKFVLKSALPYSAYLATYGLAAWIGVLGAIVTALMMLGFGSLYATPGLALTFFQEFDPTNKTHLLLSKIEIFGIWQALVLGVGLGKVTQKSVGSGVTVCVILWAVWMLITSLMGSPF